MFASKMLYKAFPLNDQFTWEKTVETCCTFELEEKLPTYAFEFVGAHALLAAALARRQHEVAVDGRALGHRHSPAR